MADISTDLPLGESIREEDILLPDEGELVGENTSEVEGDDERTEKEEEFRNEDTEKEPEKDTEKDTEDMFRMTDDEEQVEGRDDEKEDTDGKDIAKEMRSVETEEQKVKMELSELLKEVGIGERREMETSCREGKGGFVVEMACRIDRETREEVRLARRSREEAVVAATRQLMDRLRKRYFPEKVRFLTTDLTQLTCAPAGGCGRGPREAPDLPGQVLRHRRPAAAQVHHGRGGARLHRRRHCGRHRGHHLPHRLLGGGRGAGC